MRLATPLLQVPPAGGPAVLVAIDADLRSGEPTVIQGLTEQIRDICITQLDAVALAL